MTAASVRDLAPFRRQYWERTWGPQRERMEASIFFPLFLVLVGGSSIFYLSPELQSRAMFRPRSPLSQLPAGQGGKDSSIKSASPGLPSQAALIFLCRTPTCTESHAPERDVVQSPPGNPLFCPIDKGQRIGSAGSGARVDLRQD